MKVLVSGGREIRNELEIFNHLDYWDKKVSISHVLFNPRVGIGLLIGKWIYARQKEYTIMPVEWFLSQCKVNKEMKSDMVSKHLDLERVIRFPGGLHTLDKVQLCLMNQKHRGILHTSYEVARMLQYKKARSCVTASSGERATK